MADGAGLSGAEGGQAPNPTAGQQGQGNAIPEDKGPARREFAGAAAGVKPIPPGNKQRAIGAEAAASRPKPNIPGLIRRDSEPLIGSAERTADGRFAARNRNDEIEQEIEEDGEEAPEPRATKGEVAPAVDASGKPPLPPGSEVETQAPGKVKLGGKEYPSLEEADKAHRSLQGMFKPMQERIKGLTDERDYGYNAANAWIKEVQSRDARIAELEAQLGGRPGSGGQKVTQGAQASQSDELPNVEDLLSDIDGEAFEAVLQHGGTPNAAKFLAGEVLKVVREKLLTAYDAKVSKRFQPYETSGASAKQAAAADQLFESFAQMKTHDGKEAFPEVKNPAILAEIAKVWSESGLPMDHALTESGLMSAIGMWRMLKGFPTAESAQAAAVTTTASQQGAANGSAGINASVGGSEGGVAPRNEGRSNLSPQQARLAKSFKNTRLVDPVLGFAKNRRE